MLLSFIAGRGASASVVAAASAMDKAAVAALTQAEADEIAVWSGKQVVALKPAPVWPAFDMSSGGGGGGVNSIGNCEKSVAYRCVEAVLHDDSIRLFLSSADGVEVGWVSATNKKDELLFQLSSEDNAVAAAVSRRRCALDLVTLRTPPPLGSDAPSADHTGPPRGQQRLSVTLVAPAVVLPRLSAAAGGGGEKELELSEVGEGGGGGGTVSVAVVTGGQPADATSNDERSGKEERGSRAEAAESVGLPSYLLYQPIEGWPREHDPPAQAIRHDMMAVWPADLLL